MIARCYLRVSTEDQAREGYSLGAQRDRLDMFAASQGWTVEDHYTDEGISAKDTNRPALRRLLAEVQTGEVVLVYKLDRLTRSVADLDHLLRRWEADGVLFRSCTEDFNTTTAAGRLFIRLVADLAQWERENLAERTRMGMVRRAQEGEWNGGRPPFGYDAVATIGASGVPGKRRLVPNEYAPVVRELYERYVAGQGMRALTLWLNREKGLRGARGGSFTDSTVSGILRNPVYAGLTAWAWGVKNGPRGPEAIVAEGKHAAIVVRSLWEQAQQIREQRRRLPPAHAAGAHLLSGIGRCGLCGGYLKLNEDRRRHRRSYRCGHYAARGSCAMAGVPADVVEANFLAAVRAQADGFADPERAARYVAEFLQEGASRAQVPAGELRRQMGQAKQAISVWDAALERGQIQFDEWQAKTEPHRRRLQDLEAQMAAPPSALASAATLASCLTGIDAIWRAAAPAERKSLVRAFFRTVRVYPDRRVEVEPVLFAADDP